MPITLKASADAYWHDGRLQLYAEDDELQAIVGEVELYDNDPLNHRAAYAIEVYKPYRRRGYATLMIQALHTFCRSTTELHQLYVDVLDTNLVSQHLFELSGYQSVGLLRDWTYDTHTYHDTYRYQFLL